MKLFSTLPYRPFLCSMQRALLSEGLPIFAFHYTEPSPRRSPRPADYCPPEEFSRSISMMAEAGYQSLSLDALTSGLQRERKVAALTFDDGYASVVQNALPILQTFKMRATMFVVSSSLEGGSHLRARGLMAALADPGMIREWLAAGNEIGSHSVTHRNLTKLSPTEAEEEMRSSKLSLEQAFGIEVRHFAYPYGQWNHKLESSARLVGYRTAATMKFGVNCAPISKFALKRIPVVNGTRLTRHIIRRLLRSILPQ